MNIKSNEAKQFSLVLEISSSSTETLT